MTPRIAVVTPSFQQGRFLRATIESVLGQAPAGLEYYVADGGSTDESVDVLRSYGDRLRWVSEKDKGQSHAVNKGIAATSAPVIGWINSDDVYEAGAFDAVVEHFDANPEDDFVYGDADYIDEEGVRTGAYPVEPWSVERLVETCFLCQPAVFFRRRTVERYGALDESLNYCMDYEYWLRCGRLGARFGRLGRKLAYSRLYPTNKTLLSRVKVHAEHNDMFRKLLGRTPERWIYNYAHAAADDRGIRRESAWRFHCTLAAESWKASIRWRGSISGSLVRTTLQWLWTGASLELKRWGRGH